MQVYEACKQANAHSFIADAGSFPDGYLTLVGERGVRLSGGQKQRIAIARALVLQPKILLLDEATSAIDAESEDLINESIRDFARGRTVLAIAHRMATIMAADRIVVMDQGQVKEKGNYDTLMASEGLFRRLMQRQIQ